MDYPTASQTTAETDRLIAMRGFRRRRPDRTDGGTPPTYSVISASTVSAAIRVPGCNPYSFEETFAKREAAETV